VSKKWREISSENSVWRNVIPCEGLQVDNIKQMYEPLPVEKREREREEMLRLRGEGEETR
jgi:hypothetical protein